MKAGQEGVVSIRVRTQASSYPDQCSVVRITILSLTNRSGERAAIERVYEDLGGQEQETKV